MNLYPLKFQVQETSKYLNTSGREFNLIDSQNAEVINGFLQENTLEELIEVYMYDLLGESVYNRYGNTFPLQACLLNSDATSSNILVDIETEEEASAIGKLWYILDKKESSIKLGWRTDTTLKAINEAILSNNIESLMTSFSVIKDDLFYIPQNEVFQFDGKLTLFEIALTNEGNKTLELKYLTEDQKRRINIKPNSDLKKSYKKVENGVVNLQQEHSLTTNLITVNGSIARDYYPLDSFVLICCTEGSMVLSGEFDEPVALIKGECALIPAEIKELHFTTSKETSSFLESYIEIKGK